MRGGILIARVLYICRACGHGFDVPARDSCFFAHAFGVAADAADVCPQCGSGDFAAARPCGNPGCHGLRSAADMLCPACRGALRRRLSAVLLGLSPAELEQAECWLEGSCLMALLGKRGGEDVDETI